jgi:hypothetical protein
MGSGGLKMMAMTNGPTVRAERTQDEMILRLPNPNRFLRAFLPEEAVKHLLAAQREQLLAVRAIIDAAVARIEAAEQEDAAFTQRRTEITVE